ncbi:MAG: CHAT domain-containing protein [Chloroflexi bacterium]|nr:CHAT domain-containing protein [Chloroflexota bacterium]MBU1750494.1 CHAT domain-containing protein [Chloroflexota bacterium]
MQEAAVLSVLRVGKQYLVCLESPGIHQASVPVYVVDRDLVQDLAGDVERAIALQSYLRARRQGIPVVSPPAESNSLRRLGWQMYRALPGPIGDLLRQLDTPLVISTNDDRLPWELLHDGADFMALKHAVGRQLAAPGQARRIESREPGRTWKALFIANPTGDLDAAAEEADDLADLVQKLLGIEPPHVLWHRRATRKAVLGALSSGEYDLIHYSGHAFFDQDDPKSSSLILSGNEALTAHEIQENLNGQPIVFLNACESARGGTIDADAETYLAYAGLTAQGLASAFILGGALAFVGTLWVTYDDASGRLARHFYQRALRGQAIGEALRWARERIREEAPDDPIWASSALYGNPGLHLLDSHKGARRLVSVLSAQVTGLPALYGRLGADRASSIAGECLTQLHHATSVHHGEIMSLIHDTATGVFGASAAREDHAELAVQAALQMRQAMTHLDERLAEEQLDLGIRIGIDAGEVLAREIGAASEGRLTVLGPVAERARVLQEHAGVDQVLAGESVYRETGRMFDLAPAPGDVSGNPAYEVLGIKPRRERILEFLGSRAAWVGREDELSILHSCWNRCRAGHRQVVGIAGEAGIGKSRLLYEFAHAIEGEKPNWILGACSSRQQGTPLSLLTQIVWDLFEIDPGDDPAVMAVRLRARLENLGMEPRDLEEPLAVLGEVLGIELGEPDRPHDPKVRRGQLIRYLKGLLIHTAAARPTIVVLEDAHEIDDTSLEIVRQCVHEIEGIPLLLLTLYRPHRAFGWEDRAYYRNIPLTNLAEQPSYTLLCDLLAAESLPEEIARPILTRTGGNPFFLEQVVASLKETGVLTPSDGGWRIEGKLSEAQIPDSVRGTLLARIDQLAPGDRQVLQVAAVVGHGFSYRVLTEIADTDTLDADLSELCQRELIDEVSSPLASRRLSEYAFRHSLTQEVAYTSLTLEQRQHAHRRVAETLERLFPDRIEAQVGLLAHHWEQANEPRQAVEYLERAGDQTRLTYAHQEAIDYYQRAIAFQRKQKRHEQTARTLMKLGLSYHTAFDFPRARQAFEESFTLRQCVETTVLSLPAAPHALRVDWPYPPLTLDPARVEDLDSAGVVAQLFSGLVALSPRLDIVPDAAHRWEVLEDGRKYVFYLHEDGRWSDGTPVTADDFVYAWRRALAPPEEGGSPVARLLYDVKGARAFHQGETPGADSLGVQALDDHSLFVELEQPTGHFLHLLAYVTSFPVPRHVVKAHGQDWTQMGHIVTNGPFRLEDWDPEGKLTLSRHPGYRGHATGNVERVELQSLADEAARLQAYEKGELDTLALWNLPDRERVRQRHAGEYVSAPSLATTYVGFDTSRQPFDDPRVRRALALAIDKERFAHVDRQGYVFPATGGFLPPGMPGHSTEHAQPYDPAQARRLLAKAGYPGGDGFPPVEFLTDDSNEPPARYLAAQWRENLGIEIACEMTDWETFLYRLGHEPAHAFLNTWYADYADPDNFLRVCDAVRWTRWQDPTYHDLMEQARHVADLRERLDMYRRADEKLTESAVILLFTYGRQHLLIKPWVKQFPTAAVEWWFWKDVVVEPH